MRGAVWLACLGLVAACGREQETRAPAAPPIVAAPADDLGRLDPAPYRARIESAETLLYSNQALSPEDWKALSAAFLALHNEIVFADGSANARDVTARLFFLSARADAMTTSSRADAELESLRANWQKLGGEAFIPTTWMRAQAAGAR
jgi:hypothetical protein